MGSDDLFKKRRAQRQKRRHEYKKARANSYLIITEGVKTEPSYFNGIKQIIEQNLGGNVDIVECPLIDISGEGCSTMSLIKEADRIVNKANIIYQNVWLVFDKDDFDDFDSAIAAAYNKGYKAAWSNPSFEYWLYLHFNYSDSSLHRSDWNQKLDEIFKTYRLGNGTYQKNYENLFELVNTFDGMETAIKHAKRRMAGYNPESTKASAYDPGTNVHILVEELKQYMYE